ncbi:hypothetical protein [Parasediminibacterium sp. JCM 36343]|uniref:hypothetical protein n=1 Tax=Parasediminibacterium sp. JCM 36343 TaxID=3374279 RepID=UPI003978C1F0
MLIEILVPPAKGKKYNHKKGCRNVAKELQENSLKDEFAVAIIDKNKNSIDYLKVFLILDEVQNDLILYRHKNEAKHHYFIQICPAVEKWIFKVCDEEAISLNDFGLPCDFDRFKLLTKSQDSTHDKRFLELFNRFRSSNNPKVKKLKGWIKLLKEKNYQVDIKELRNA